MDDKTLFIIQEIAFWIFFIAFLYFLFIRPKTNKKREEKFYKGFQSGDNIVTYQGVVGKVVSVQDGKVIFASGSKNNRFTVSLDRIKKNVSYTRRRKEYIKSLSLLNKFKEVL